MVEFSNPGHFEVAGTYVAVVVRMRYHHHRLASKSVNLLPVLAFVIRSVYGKLCGIVIQDDLGSEVSFLPDDASPAPTHRGVVKIEDPCWEIFEVGDLDVRLDIRGDDKDY